MLSIRVVKDTSTPPYGLRQRIGPMPSQHSSITGSGMAALDDTSFESFYRIAEPRVRLALTAGFGFDHGREATADAFAYAWEHWERVGTTDNPAGYVYRVGQRRARRSNDRWRRPPALTDGVAAVEPWIEPRLSPALHRLSVRQRTAVVLVHCFDWSLRDTADLMGIAVTSVQNHADRGMAKLRNELRGTS